MYQLVRNAVYLFLVLHIWFTLAWVCFDYPNNKNEHI
jgi:hypothetical protein